MAKLAKCEGLMGLKEAGGYVTEIYEEEFLLSDSVENLAQARSIIQNGLIKERLKKKYPKFYDWRECQVVSLETTDAKVETGELEQLLLKCSEAGCVPENLSSYASDKSKTKALQKALDNHEKRIASQREKEKAENILRLAGA